ncbi:MAG TPA: alkaline phosphatase PhoX [Polyangiaceae bacterium]|nr:alkaline phosphatase PhoX [Polyangiaceae bacterium]
MQLRRRAFLQGCLSWGAAASGLGQLACSNGAEPDGSGGGGAGGSGGAPAAVPFGPLVADPEGILDLPEGFSYVILERTGDVMSDGHAMGDRPDGMACFDGPDGTYVLMRNHESDEGASPEPSLAYNPNMLGGVSRVVVDRESLARLGSNWVLCGTHHNCAGGPSPWGWLSCEESTLPQHGYVFVCDPAAEQTQPPQRAPSLGCFKHEAVAVDPKTEIFYLTEDQSSSALYRHLPIDGPFVGRLQALKVRGRDNVALSEGLSVGDRLEIEWVDVDDAEGTELSTFEQASARGAAVVVRGEGIWFSEGSIFFVSTEGGPAGLGQVFRLDPEGDSGAITLIAQAEDDQSLINPDNITVSPAGQVFVVEDNNGPNHIWRIGDDGEVEAFARNASNGGVSEFCGVCFSPDGKVMFVNMQEEGLTFAIRGPF